MPTKGEQLCSVRKFFSDGSLPYERLPYRLAVRLHGSYAQQELS